MRKIIFLLLGLFSVTALSAKVKKETLSSPDGRLKVKVAVADDIRYSITHGGDVVIKDSPLSLTVRKRGVLGLNPELRGVRRNSVKEEVKAPFHRNSSFVSEYNEMTLNFKGGYSLVFRAFNDGAAYRFVTYLKGEMIVDDEEAAFRFDKDHYAYIPHLKERKIAYMSAYQCTYDYMPISALEEGKRTIMPLVVELDGGKKCALMESDVRSYPDMFLRKGTDGFRSEFAPLPSETSDDEVRRQENVNTRHDYIAKVKGARSFPWRIVAVVGDDAELLANNLVYALASPNEIGDTSWIKPGKVAWDWWNNWGVYGVDFKVGINNETYKYFIDFASANSIEYVVLDEGWYDPRGGDMLETIEDIDLSALVSYAKAKNVRLILWTVGKVLDEQLEAACLRYSALGIAGFKVDFFDRNDQLSNERIERIARVCAKYRMMVDYHGVAAQTGQQRTFPNAINFEGVFGLEELKWSNPDMPKYDVTMPFIRQLAGPVDYTQGAMRNASKENFRDIFNSPMSQGTRAHQLATYIVFESPLVMLCDSPTAYMKNQECTDAIAALPVVFDEMRVLSADIAEYAVIARRSGNDWYIGGLTSWTARDTEIDLSFLGSGDYTATIFRDGRNTYRSAEDYVKEVRTVAGKEKLNISMASGGGFLITLKRAF